MVAQIEKILDDYFKKNDVNEKGLLTVKYLSEQVHLPPGYLSDLLKKETGKNPRDHIHFYVIEEAKNILLSTNKSVGENSLLLRIWISAIFQQTLQAKNRENADWV